MDIGQIQQQISQANLDNTQALPPVDQWNPPFCGDMNLVIKRSGQWWHEGTPFTRAKLIKLLSSVLKKESDAYFLVTPVEKIGITVEDVPFIVIDSEHTSGGIQVITQTGDTATIGIDNPIELRPFENTQVPYCLIRRNLWARLHQNVLYRWIEAATEQKVGNQLHFMLQSGQYQFCIGTSPV